MRTLDDKPSTSRSAFDVDAAARSPIALALTEGPHHDVRYANAALLSLCEIEAGAIAGRAMPELFCDAAAIARALDAAYMLGTVTFADARSRSDQPLAIVAAPQDVPTRPTRGLLVQVAPGTDSPMTRMSDELREANQQLLMSGLREHEAADRARQSASELRALLEGMNEGVTVFDRNGNIVLVNTVGQEVFGLRAPTPTLDDFQRGELQDLAGHRLDYGRDLLAKVLRGESFADFELIRRAPDGREQRLVVSGSAVRDGRDEVALAIHIYRDVTALRELERVREQHIALISHDLRGPLATAKMAIQLLAMTPPSPRHRWLVERAIANLGRIEQMTEDLLDVQRIRSGKALRIRLSACDLVAIVSEVADELRALHGARIVVGGDASAAGFWDCDQIRRAVWNLVGNALKHGDPTAPVRVTVRGEEDRVTTTVHNHGRPIPKSAQDRLFSPFTEAKVSRGAQGWGLGLTLVHGAASAHGGSIEVDSDEESGTTFTLVLPRDGRRALAPATPPPRPA